MKQLTADEIRGMVGDPENVEILNGWLERGDGVCVYENADLGHPHLGHKKFLSYGSHQAMFNGAPPQRLPDMMGEINWRYQLVGTYEGEAL